MKEGHVVRKLDTQTIRKIQTAIRKNIAELEKTKGFVAAEPGFRTVNGWIKHEPAIVVSVAEKLPKSELLSEDIAPKKLDGFRVDVVQASPEQLLASSDDFAGVMGTLALAAADLTYEKRPGNPIDSLFTLTKPMTCHSGPDAGWPVLDKFLRGTKKTLTVAIYDLNAPYIVKTLIETIRANDTRKLVLVWDAGMTQDEPRYRAELKEKLGAQMDGWLATSVMKGGGTRWSSAYHEKVAVRDRKAFWLSSGNWSKRSQPGIDPIGNPADAAGMYGKGNREWHIVVEDEPLARVFEDYILYDRDGSHDAATALAALDLQMPDVLVPAAYLALPADLALAAPNPVAPQVLPTHGQPYQVRPLLCPDNYIERITKFVKSAQHKLSLQFAYITYSKSPDDRKFRALLDYLCELSYKPSFDLRVIVNNDPEKIRKLVEAGFNEKKLKVQSNIHNKAIIVDDQAALVCSANWSGDGTLRNRDAGLIIYDPEVTAYFQAIYDDDWNLRAKQDFGDPVPVQLAAPGQPTPSGMVRIRWEDFHND